jgi:hypothetical protein
MIWKHSEEIPRFRVQCNACEAGDFEIASKSVKLQIGQTIRKDGREEIWDSLRVECRAQDDGTLAVEIVISHPLWDRPLRIAYAESAPKNGNTEEPALGFDLEHTPV